VGDRVCSSPLYKENIVKNNSISGQTKNSVNEERLQNVVGLPGQVLYSVRLRNILVTCTPRDQLPNNLVAKDSRCVTWISDIRN
jgi:hypothetical protein